MVFLPEVLLLKARRAWLTQVPYLP